MRSLSFRRHLFVLALALVMALGSVAAPWAVRPVAAADATIVFAALEVLRDGHVSAPDPLKLLAAAVDGVRRALAQAGITATLPVVSAGNETLARQEFQTFFDQAAAAAAGRVSETDLQHAAASAMAESLGDSHTAFIPPDRWQQIQREQRGEAGFTGVGIRLLPRDGRFYIQHVFPGSPAARAGLRDFDRITAVDGQSTEGMNSQTISSRIRGPQGTTVAITVARPGQREPLTVTITREPIVVPPADFRLLEGQVGYLRIFHFDRGAGNATRRALQDLLQQGMRALVLDLRGNPGGSVDEVISVASALLPEGLTIMVRESRNRRVTNSAIGGPILPPALPLVVLTDGGSASGSEIVSAAVQDHQRGTLVGMRTAGALTASQYFELPGGAALQVTVSRVLTPKGTVVEGVGLQPDVEVDLTTADLDQGIDTQLQRALQQLPQRVLVPVQPVLVPAA